MTAVTAAAARRSTVPTARASTAATASSAAVPAITRSSVSDDTGNTKLPLLRVIRSPSATATIEPTSPATKVTKPITTAFAARTRPRAGPAVRVVRIRPRRYSAVMNSVAKTIITISPANAPPRSCSMVCPTDNAPATIGVMSPDPVTVNLPWAWSTPPRWAADRFAGPPIWSPRHAWRGHWPCKTAWSKTPLARVGALVIPPRSLLVTVS
jgi:hypothetical protein